MAYFTQSGPAQKNEDTSSSRRSYGKKDKKMTSATDKNSSSLDNRKRKRLDARTYRAHFMTIATRLKSSDLDPVNPGKLSEGQRFVNAASTSDATSSSVSEPDRMFIEQCSVCSTSQRMNNAFKDQDLCSCKPKTRCALSTSLPESGRAASFLKHKVDHKELLVLTEKDMNSAPLNTSVENESMFPEIHVAKKLMLESGAVPDHRAIQTDEIEEGQLFMEGENAARDLILEVSPKIALSEHEGLEGEIREGHPSVPDEDVVNHLMHKDILKIASNDPEEVEEGKTEKSQTSAPREDVAKDLVHYSSEMASSDHEEMEEGEIRDDHPKDYMQGPQVFITSLNHEPLEEGERRGSPFNSMSFQPTPSVPKWHHSQTSAPRKDIAKDLVHYCHSKMASSKDEEMEEGEIRDDHPKDYLHGPHINIASLDHEQLEEGEGRESLFNSMSCQSTTSVQKQDTVLEAPFSVPQHILSLKGELLNKQIALIDKICKRRSKELLLRQKLELEKFKMLKEKQKKTLMETHNSDAFPRDQELKEKLDKFELHMKDQRRKLAVMQIQARNNENLIKVHWLKEAKGGKLNKSFDELPLSKTRFKLKKFMSSEQHRAYADSENSTLVVSSSSDLTERPVELNKPTCISAYAPAVVSCGGTEDVLLNSRTPVSHADSKNSGLVVSSSLDLLEKPVELEIPSNISTKIPAIASGGETQDVLVDTSTPVSQASCMNEMKSYEHTSLSYDASAAIQHGGNISTEIPGIASGGGTEYVMETRSRISQSSCMNMMESYEQCKPPYDVSKIIQHGGANGMHMDAETLAPQSKEMNVVGNGFDASDKSSEMVAIDDNSQHGGIVSDCAWITDVHPKRQMEIPSLVVMPENSQCEKTASCNQVPLINDQEGSTVCKVGSNQEMSSPQNSVAPAICSVDAAIRHVDPTVHTSLVSEPTMRLLSSRVGLASVTHGRASTSGPAQTDQPSSSQLTQGTMQQSFVVTTTQSEQCIHPFSRPAEHPTSPVGNMPPLRAHSEHIRATSVQSEMGSRLPLCFISPQSMPQEELHPDPLQSELIKLHRLKDLFAQKHEDKKLQLKREHEKELDDLRRKYDSLIQDEETEFIKIRRHLEIICGNIRKQQILAENFWKLSSETMKVASNICQGQCLSSSQQFVQQPPTPFTEYFVSPSSTTTVSARTSLHPSPNPSSSSLRRPWAPSSSVASAPAVQAMHSTEVLTSDVFRPKLSSLFPSLPNLHHKSELRAPPPHLRSFRSSLSASTAEPSIVVPSLYPQTRMLLNQQQHNMGTQSSVQQISSLLAPVNATPQSRGPVGLASFRDIAQAVVGYNQDLAGLRNGANPSYLYSHWN